MEDGNYLRRCLACVCSQLEIGKVARLINNVIDEMPAKETVAEEDVLWSHQFLRWEVCKQSRVVILMSDGNGAR